MSKAAVCASDVRAPAGVTLRRGLNSVGPDAYGRVAQMASPGLVPGEPETFH